MKTAEIIYGSNLKNKDNYIFSKMKDIIDGGGKVLYIVPEQFAFSADKSVLFRLGEKYSHLTETINFKRMALTVNESLNPTKKDYITEEIKTLILYKIYLENISKFKSLSKRGSSPDSVLLFSDILTELKTNLITEEELEKLISALPEGTFLYGKLWDLKLIFSEYEKYIEESYRDFGDSFSMLTANIEKHGLYKDYDIFIDNFIHFSKSEYTVLEALFKNAKSVHVSLFLDDFSKKDESDLFYLTKNTADAIFEIAQESGMEIQKTVCAEHDEKQLFEIFSDEICNKKSKNLELISAKTRTDEVRWVVSKIKELVFEGASYNDIGVFTGDTAVYEDIIEKCFLEAKITYFDDRKTALWENPVCRLLAGAFEFYVSGYSLEEMMCYLKSLLFLFDASDSVCLFEETASNFRLQREFICNPEKWDGFLDMALRGNKYLTARKKTINSVYEKFILPVAQSFSPLKKKNTASDYLSAFSCFIKAMGIEKKLKYFTENSDDTAFCAETVTAYNTFLKALKNIAMINGETPMTKEDYFELLKQSAGIYKTGRLPNVMDCVTVSDTERGRSEGKKYVFILGLNDEVTPKTNNSTGFLSDNDRKLIESITGVFLPTAMWKNCSSLLSFYRTCALAEEKLYVSKSALNDDGNELTASYMWNRFCEKAEKITEFEAPYVTAVEAVSTVIAMEDSKSELYKLAYSRESQLFSDMEKMKDEDYFSLNKRVSKEIINSKYQKKLNTSVSRLETYRKCGYSYFLKFLLRACEPENAEYDFAKTGTLVHDIIDMFSRKMAENKLDWGNITEEYTDESLKSMVYREITEKFPKMNMFNPRTKYLMGKITRTAKTAILYIKEHFISGSFVPLGYEIPIDENGVKPISIALSDGSILEIYGRADRADGFFDTKSDTLYIRIIDYKSSAKTIEFAMVKEGIQLQLLTYLHSLVKNGGEYFDFSGKIMPGAALYMAFDHSMKRFDTKPMPEDLRKEAAKKFSLDGIVLNDDDIIEAMDKEIINNPSYNSEVVNITRARGGAINIKNLLYREQFAVLLEDCEKIIKETGEKIIDGEFFIKPYRYGQNTACDYCSYKAICGFDNSINSYRTVSKLSKDDYFNKKGE